MSSLINLKGKIAPSRVRDERPGGPKKNGGGGKFTYGRPGDELDLEDVDKDDPCYTPSSGDIILVSEDMIVKLEEGGRLFKSRSRGGEASDSGITLSEFKLALVEAIDEYFVSSDKNELRRSIAELRAPIFAYEVVKRLITKSMDVKLRECELVSQFFALANGDILGTDDFTQGFEKIFETADDLEIDIPRARNLIANFLARAVVDECIPPSFLSDPVIQRLGGSIIDQAKILLSLKHSAAKIEKIWGPGDGRTVNELKMLVKDTLMEYLINHDCGEAARCIVEMNSPNFHHEIIMRGINITVDKKEEEREIMSTLFTYLVVYDVISLQMVAKGFERTKLIIPDLQIDCPHAISSFNGFIERAKKDTILPSTFH